MTLLLNILGIIVVISGLYLFSENKEKVDKKLIAKALLAQFVLVFLLVKFPLGQNIIRVVSDFVTNVLSYGFEGVAFVFGALTDDSAGYIFAISVLANIVFTAALVAALYYLGVINFIVKLIGGTIQKLFGTSKVESFVAKGEKVKKNKLNFGGNANELWCEGGELHFLLNMISESRKYRKNCGWFTSLVSKEKNLDKLYAKLKAVHVSEYKIIRMCQGTKNSRILAWRFLE